MANHTGETDLAEAAGRLYEAEVAPHTARRTAADAWIAADGLHEAVLALG